MQNIEEKIAFFRLIPHDTEELFLKARNSVFFLMAFHAAIVDFIARSQFFLRYLRCV